MLYRVPYSVVIWSEAMTWISIIGACIMQRKQAFTTIQPAQCTRIEHEIESEASELIADLTQMSTDLNSEAKPGHLVFNSLTDIPVNRRRAFARECSAWTAAELNTIRCHR